MFRSTCVIKYRGIVIFFDFSHKLNKGWYRCSVITSKRCVAALDFVTLRDCLLIIIVFIKIMFDKKEGVSDNVSQCVWQNNMKLMIKKRFDKIIIIINRWHKKLLTQFDGIVF